MDDLDDFDELIERKIQTAREPNHSSRRVETHADKIKRKLSLEERPPTHPSQLVNVNDIVSTALNSISNTDDTEATLFVPQATFVQEMEMNQQECCSASSSKSPTSDIEFCNRIYASSCQNNRENNFPIYAVASPLSFWNKS